MLSPTPSASSASLGGGLLSPEAGTRRLDALHREGGLAPCLQPSAQRVHVVEADGGCPKGYLGAGRLSGFSAVEDDLAVSGNRPAGMRQLLGIDQARTRDLVRGGLDVERRSQVDDPQRVAPLEPALQCHRRDASLPEMNEEATPSLVLEHEVRGQGGGEHDDEGCSNA